MDFSAVDVVRRVHDPGGTDTQLINDSFQDKKRERKSRSTGKKEFSTPNTDIFQRQGKTYENCLCNKIIIFINEIPQNRVESVRNSCRRPEF